MSATSRPGTYNTLRDSDVKSFAQARAEIPRTLSGLARNLYELVAGRSPRSGEPATSGLNPSGDVGVNYSGPPWGSAYRHTVAHCGVSVVDGDVAIPETYANGVGDSYLALLQNNGGSAVLSSYKIDMQLDHRPFQDIGDKAPYSRLYLYVKAKVLSGSNTTLQIYDGLDALSERRAASGTVTSTATWFNTGLWIKASPTGRTHAQILMRLISSSTSYVGIEKWTLDQIVKRSH